ncbi:MAG: NRDE family protein [Planctomycetota bacterium]
MCTATLIPLPRGGLRLLHNRDEQRARPIAPDLCSGPDFAYPIDPVGGGTWAAVKANGLGMALLNRNPLAADKLPRPSQPQTRGRVILDLLDCTDLHAVAERAQVMSATRFLPFELIAFDDQAVLTFAWMGSGYAESNDAERLLVKRQAISQHDPPTLWSSSGLGDNVVEADRRGVFARAFGSDPERWPDQQAALHRSVDPSRSFAGFCMSRDDARTVSQTELTVTPQAVELDYRLWSDGAATPCAAQTVRLDRKPVASAADRPSTGPR